MRHGIPGPSDDRLRCPRCGGAPLDATQGAIVCPSCGTTYRRLQGRPVLLDSEHPLYALHDREATDHPVRRRRWPRPSPSVNLSAERCLRDLAQRLGGRGASVLLVGAGNQRAVLTPRLAKSGAGDAEVVAIDVDARADVDVVADAHALPFIDGSFDAVVVTAVIEHVLRAEVVMAEIVRVLRPGGLLYSEVPFVQQVHEGALDFTRYTLSGHRLLAREFEELESGATAGPATALVWALEHFALALVDARTPRRRAVVKAVVRGAAGWLKWLDRIIANRPAGLDGASCTYFYGRLGDGGVSDESIVAGYRGAQ